MNIPAEIWSMFQALAIGYGLFVLNRSDRNQRELFKRIRAVELVCASTHGGHLHKRETDNEDT